MSRLLALTLALLTGCASAQSARLAALSDAVPVSGEQAVRLVTHGALLLDVSHRALQHARPLRGARVIPYEELALRIHELPRDRPLVLFSFDGCDASAAELFLRARGFDARLLGTAEAWELARAPGSGG